MTSLTTLEFANALVADAERRWLYGHPYRSEPGERRVHRHPGRAPDRAGAASAAARDRRRARRRAPPRPRRLTRPSMARVQRVPCHRRRR